MINWNSVKSFITGEDPAKLEGFSPSPVYRNKSLEFNRDMISPMTQIGRAAGYNSTYWPVETYGINKNKPGNYVIAFTGAHSGVGAGRDWKYDTDVLDKRYGKGNYAVFTPSQVNQATTFVNSLPKGSQIHVTAHSQGGGSAINFLNGLKNKPENFIHSVHLYDAVNPDVGQQNIQPLPSYINKVKHFLPSIVTPYNYWADTVADIGGRYGEIQGANNIYLNADHHKIWSRGVQIPKPQITSTQPADITYPNAVTPINNLSRYDLATVMPKGRGYIPPAPQNAVQRVYRPAYGTYQVMANPNGNPAFGKVGTGVMPQVDVANPDAYMRSIGIPRQIPGKETYTSYYRDKGVDSALAGAKRSSPFADSFFDAVRNITVPTNPSIVKELLNRRDIGYKGIENIIEEKINNELTTALQNQTPRDAITGYGYLLNGLQRDINRLWLQSQMSFIKGDKTSARNLARASALSQSILNKLVVRANTEIDSMIKESQQETVPSIAPPTIDDTNRIRFMLTGGLHR